MTDLTFERWCERLSEQLSRPLPGADAQMRMAPRPRQLDVRPADDGRSRPAAVLALIHPGSAGELPEPTLILTRRTEIVATHKGQVCLPGGAVEADEPALEAALREVEEEIGVPRSCVRVLGKLTPLHVAASGYEIQPFVGVANPRPPFQLLEHEVAEILEPSLAHLLDPGNLREEVRTFRGRQVHVPFIRLGSMELWGATAMVVSELLSIVRRMEQRTI